VEHDPQRRNRLVAQRDQNAASPSLFATDEFLGIRQQ
jgi:hypothetical protein